MSLLAHALALGPKTNYLFVYLLFLNLLLSMLNTALLSFVVRALQSDELGLRGAGLGGLAPLGWDRQLDALALGLPTSLLVHEESQQGGAAHSLAVRSIESSGSLDVEFLDRRLAGSPSSERHRDQAWISISTGRAAPPRDERGQTPVQAGPGPNALLIAGAAPHGAASRARPVELRANRLALRTLPAGQVRVQGGRQLGASLSSDSQRPIASGGRSLLDYDAERGLILLPGAERLELHPTGSGALITDDELSCPAGIQGTLDADLDVQARNGSLSCESGDSLQLVSRSARLNVIAGQALTLSSPELKLSAPKTGKLYLAGGLEFLDEPAPSALSSGRGGGAGQSAFSAQAALPSPGAAHSYPRLNQEPLAAYRLLLVDGRLMAELEQPS